MLKTIIRFPLRLALIIGVMTLVFSMVALPTHSAQASANCNVLDVANGASASYSLVAGQTYTEFVYYNGALVLGTPVTVTVTTSSSGTYTAPSGYRVVVILANCYDGAAVPVGFVLKTITCNTAVFDSAGGSAIPGASITAGQTWYVNPKSVTDAKGRAWTEIFVSGVSNGFVWSSCVK